MDQYDVAILVELQRDGRLSNRELSERIGLSPTPCWRRVRDLESDGVIQRYAALLDPVAIGIQVTALANVILEDHHPDTVAEFDTTIATIPEVLECHMLSGDYDYALKMLKEVPYGAWRAYDPRDTMRFFALRLHEAGIVGKTPSQIIESGVDWGAFDALKRELKA